MAALNLKLLLLQSYTQEKVTNLPKGFNVCELLILNVPFKKVTQKPLNISLNHCVQIFLSKRNFIHKKKLCTRKV